MTGVLKLDGVGRAVMRMVLVAVHLIVVWIEMSRCSYIVTSTTQDLCAGCSRHILS
jgi:hypothetical protein